MSSISNSSLPIVANRTGAPVPSMAMLPSVTAANIDGAFHLFDQTLSSQIACNARIIEMQVLELLSFPVPAVPLPPPYSATAFFHITSPIPQLPYAVISAIPGAIPLYRVGTRPSPLVPPSSLPVPSLSAAPVATPSSLPPPLLEATTPSASVLVSSSSSSSAPVVTVQAGAGASSSSVANPPSEANILVLKANFYLDIPEILQNICKEKQRVITKEEAHDRLKSELLKSTKSIRVMVGCKNAYKKIIDRSELEDFFSKEPNGTIYIDERILKQENGRWQAFRAKSIKSARAADPVLTTASLARSAAAFPNPPRSLAETLVGQAQAVTGNLGARAQGSSSSSASVLTEYEETRAQLSSSSSSAAAAVAAERHARGVSTPPASGNSIVPPAKKRKNNEQENEGDPKRLRLEPASEVTSPSIQGIPSPHLGAEDAAFPVVNSGSPIPLGEEFVATQTNATIEQVAEENSSAPPLDGSFDPNSLFAN